MPKVELKEKIAAVDLGARDLWDELDDENKKTLKNELFILNRYISNVSGQKREIQEHFVLAVNEFYNKHWNTLQKHPQLLWQLLCLCSHDSKRTFFHQWLGLKKKTSDSKKINFLSQVYPNAKMSDIDQMAELMSTQDFKQLAADMGYSDKEIAKLF